MNIKRLKRNDYVFLGGMLAALDLLVYLLVYYYNPFDHFTNRLILGFLTIITAGFSASLLLMMTRFFEPGEPPRAIWLNFGIGMACWAVSEAVWSFYSLIDAEAPPVSWADVGWGLGYFFFFVAMTRQFQMVFLEKKALVQNLGIIGTLLLLVITGILTIFYPDLQEQAPGFSQEYLGMFLQGYINIFYPLADLFLGILALYLVFTFQQGRLAYPWLSLLVFVFADVGYLWASNNNLYGFAESNISLIIDTIYMLAYLVLGWGVAQQYLLLWLGTSDLVDQLQS